MNISWFYLQGILIQAGIYMVAALGLSLLTGFTGLFSFGHAAFMAIGGYTTAMTMALLGLPFPLALVLGGCMATVVSFLIGRLTLNLKGDYFCIATLGFGEAIRLILDNVQVFGGARGWPNIPMKTNLVLVIAVDIIALALLSGLIKSKYGRNMKAIREDELAAQMAGINVFKHKITSFMISAFYAGIAGGMLATYLTFLQPKMFQMVKSTELTIMVIFGGLGSISGTAIGSAILVSLPEILRQFSDWRLVIYGAIVIFIIVVRPEGLLGGKELSVTGIRKMSMQRKHRKAMLAKAETERRNSDGDIGNKQSD